jgi:tRNA(Arg) A34 adenosine deaminase TadA
MPAGDPARAWDRALELAWEAFRGGTTPVGAVVIDAAGKIVAEGRGRRYEKTGPPGQLANAHVAHAELNALAGLAPERHYQDHALLTTLEPCGMCHGAAIQACVGRMAFAAADPYAGTGTLVFPTIQAQRHPLTVVGPLDGTRGRLAELLHIVYLLQRPARPHVIAAQRLGLPAMTALAEHPQTLRTFTEASAENASLTELQAAVHL